MKCAMTDADRIAFDRRLFLRGLTLTSAGLVVPLPIISVSQLGVVEYSLETHRDYYTVNRRSSHLSAMLCVKNTSRECRMIAMDGLMEIKHIVPAGESIILSAEDYGRLYIFPADGPITAAFGYV